MALCIVKMLQTSGRPGSLLRRRCGSVNAPLSLFQNASGLLEEGDRVALRFAHLALAVEAHDARRVRQARLRLGEGLAEAMVEAAHRLARELEVLQLVLADRDDGRLVEQDVRAHEHRVGEEARRATCSLPSLFSLNCVIR